MPQGSSIVRDGVRIIQGTPMTPLTRPTLFLRVARLGAPGKRARTEASLTMARPSAKGYLIKELIPDMELDPRAAVDKAVAIAKRGDVAEIYLNANLDLLPVQSAAALG